MTRRICASFLLLGLLWQSAAGALACTLNGPQATPAGHARHGAIPAQAHAHEHQTHMRVSDEIGRAHV